MTPLMLHRTCEPGPVRSVTASIEATRDGCRARFRLEGTMSGIKLPAHAQSERTDDLWRTTCFEIFWQPIGGKAYREFNLSPSGRWASYDFNRFREGMRDAPVPSISLACSHSGHELELIAAIAADLAAPAQVALNAVVEPKDGAMQYWALGFPPGKPEFHSEACRTLVVDRG